MVVMEDKPYRFSNLDRLSVEEVQILNRAHLLLAQPENSLEEVMNKRVKKIKINDSSRKVIGFFRKYDYVVAPVVDEENVIKGLITLKDAIEAEMPEFRHPKKRK